MGSSQRKSSNRKGAAKNLLSHKMHTPNSYYTGTHLLYRCMQARLPAQAQKASPQPFSSSSTLDPTREQTEKTEGPLGGRSQFQTPEIVFNLRESKHTMPLRSKVSSARKESFSADIRGIRVRQRNRHRLPSIHNKWHSHMEESQWETYSISKFSLFFSLFKILAIKYHSSETAGGDTRYVLKEVKDLKHTHEETGEQSPLLFHGFSHLKNISSQNIGSLTSTRNGISAGD